MTAVYFHRRGDTYTVTFAYDPALVELVKSVPSWARSWHPSTKSWHVHVVYAPELARDMRRYGYDVVGTDDVAPHRQCSWAVQLFDRVGPSRSDAVHRALTKVLHPDTPTGDVQLQQELNDARAELVPKTRSTAA